MYNVHPYFSLKNLGKNVCTVYSKNTVTGTDGPQGAARQGQRYKRLMISKHSVIAAMMTLNYSQRNLLPKDVRMLCNHIIEWLEKQI